MKERLKTRMGRGEETREPVQAPDAGDEDTRREPDGGVLPPVSPPFLPPFRSSMRLIFGVSARGHRLSIPEMEIFAGNGINERDANIPSGGS